MGQGQEAGEEGGTIVWQSKSYRETVHWKCNPAKRKAALYQRKRRPSRQSIKAELLVVTWPAYALSFSFRCASFRCAFRNPCRRGAEIPIKAASKKERTIWHFPRLLTTS